MAHILKKNAEPRIFLIDGEYEHLVLSNPQMEDAMTTKFQFVIIHRFRNGDLAVMPGVYKTKAAAEIDCDRYAAIETDAQNTYSAAQVSTMLRVSNRAA